MANKRKIMDNDKENCENESSKRFCKSKSQVIPCKRAAGRKLKSPVTNKRRRLDLSPSTSSESSYCTATSTLSFSSGPQPLFYSDWELDSANENEENFDATEQHIKLTMLPDHALSRIMDNLPRQDKLNLALTCRLFERIFNEPANMKNFPLVLNFDTNNIQIPRRRYRIVEVKNIAIPATNKRISEIRDVFRSMGEYFVKIHFKQCSLSDNFLLDMMRFCKNVEELTFSNCKMFEGNSNNYYSRFPKLKILITDIKSIFAAAQLMRNVETLVKFVVKANGVGVTMKTTETAWNLRLYHYSLLKEYLANQVNLKTLELSDSAFFEEKFTNVEFQLTNLVFNHPNVEREQPTNMMNFLQRQNEISHMILNARLRRQSQSFNSSLHHLMRLPSLRSLKLVFYSGVEMNTAFLRSPIVNPKVEALYISFRGFPHEYRRLIEKTATIFPALKSLYIRVDKEWLSLLNTNQLTFKPLNALKDLKDLAIEGGSTRFISMLELPSLKRIHLHQLHEVSADDITSFLTKNRQVEEIAFLFPEVSENIEHQRNLVSLIIHYFEESIKWLRGGVAIMACVNSTPIPTNILIHLKNFAQENMGPNLMNLQICSKKLLE